MSDTSTGGGGCSMLLMAGLALLAAFVIFGAGASAGGDTPSGATSTTQTETNVHVLSDNTVRILSPDTYVYYNSGDTSQVVSGDRNIVAAGSGGCWVSSAQSWGPCPAGAPDGNAVP